MPFLTLGSLDAKEEEALARYRAAQQRSQAAASATSPSRGPTARLDRSTATDHVGTPVPPGSRLPDPRRAAVGAAAVSYTVQRGDTLRGIADWFYGDRSRWLAIFAANRSTIEDPLALEAGLVLTIPRRGGSQPLA
jgi:nucleoid-associated protein YgaU